MDWISEYGQMRQTLEAQDWMELHEAEMAVCWLGQPFPFPFVVSSDFSQMDPAWLMTVHCSWSRLIAPCPSSTE